MVFNTFGGLWWGNLYGLFGLAFLLGLILFLVWAAKTLKPERLYQTSITLLVIGIIGWLLFGLGGTMMGGRSGANGVWGSGMQGGFGQGMMMGGMMQCAQDEECFNAMGQMMNRMGNIKSNAK